MWAIGVITYFLLCGYTPFDRDTNLEEMQAILAADYKFEPADYWQDVSDNGMSQGPLKVEGYYGLTDEPAREFIRKCLTTDPTKRLTAHQALQHPFLSDNKEEAQADLLPVVRKNFNARRTLHAAIDTIRAINKLREGGVMDGALSIAPETQKDTPASQNETNTGLWRKPAGGLMKQ